ncbi:Transcriptional regulator, DeoR [Bacillus cereus AH1271]|uniref:helix-turn-helix transcriptional regulator n=2 Tax=Bacillaceae TaxID=186817 RepID=UPI0001A1318E|nr:MULTISPECIES: WYL domain-containing protein [Bacillus]AYF07581.1 WYL domain-containing protein [Bacillus mobilis]EEL80981.1 Transcriptional regulator, DeoR [Bacillus cereus AH1271]PDZ69892.1 alkaline phosphatase [Bacillus cereus]PER33232.1 alkaline phosphatase [Bacillus cereus]PEU76485.1 alkaline phosphatase [Bacillus cereus]
MKKTERINDMLIYLNNKRYFNLRDLMVRYDISKSTALRDIQSLEEIGVPIYSELGRNGSYKIIENSVLSPIYFSVDEMYALYFSILTLNGYKTKPFNIESIALENKFKHVLPDNVSKNISIMERTLSFEVTNHSNFSPYLKEILQGIFAERVYQLTYLKKDAEKVLVAQFIRIESKFGQWYAKIFNFEANHVQIIRCDKILSIEETSNTNPKNLEELLSYLINFHRKPDATDFIVIVNQKGKDIFDKENYPSMKIKKENENYSITGYFNKQEVEFIASYFLNFGETIISIQPVMLKELIYNKVLSIKQHLTSLRES